MSQTQEIDPRLSLILELYEAVDRLAAVHDRLPDDLRIVLAGWSGDRVLTVATNEPIDTALRMALKNIAEAVRKLPEVPA